MPDPAVQEAVLGELMERFNESRGAVAVDVRELVDELEQKGVSEEAVRDGLERLDERGSVDLTIPTNGARRVRLEPRGVQTYVELNGETVVPNKHFRELAGEIAEFGESAETMLNEFEDSDVDAS